MQVMQPRSKKGPSWANETQTVPVDEPLADVVVNDSESQGLSDLEWMKKHMSQAADTEEKVFEQDGEELETKLPEVWILFFYI